MFQQVYICLGPHFMAGARVALPVTHEQRSLNWHPLSEPTRVLEASIQALQLMPCACEGLLTKPLRCSRDPDMSLEMEQGMEPLRRHIETMPSFIVLWGTAAGHKL